MLAVSQAFVQRGMVKDTYGSGCFILMNTGAPVVSHNQLLTTVDWTLQRNTDLTPQLGNQSVAPKDSRVCDQHHIMIVWGKNKPYFSYLEKLLFQSYKTPTRKSNRPEMQMRPILTP